MRRALVCLVILGLAAPAEADALDDVAARVQKVRSRLARPPAELAPAQSALRQARAHDDAAAEAEARVQLRDPDATVQAKRVVEERRAAGRAAEVAHRKLREAARHLASGDRAALDDAAQASGALAAFFRGDPARALRALTPELMIQFPSLRRIEGLAAAALGDQERAWQALSTAPLAATDVPAQLALGQLAEARHDWERARRAYGDAFTAAPAEHAAGVGLCLALIALGRADEARAPLQMLAEGGRDRRASYLLAVLAERDGQARRTEELLGRVVGVEPSSEAAQPEQSYRRAGRPLLVLPLDPLWGTLPPELDPVAAAAHLAARWLARGDATGALRLVQTASTAEALYVRGLAERHLGKLDDAKRDLKRASELAPERHEPRCAWGVTILEAGDAATAQETLELDGDHPASMLAEAVALGQLGRADRARAQLTALSKQPGAIGDAAKTDLGALERAAGRLDAALRALPERPLTPVGWLLRGLVLGGLQQSGASLAALRASVAAQPAYLDAWLALGRTAEQAGDSTAALEAATRALAIDPAHGEALALKGRVAAKSKR